LASVGLFTLFGSNLKWRLQMQRRPRPDSIAEARTLNPFFFIPARFLCVHGINFVARESTGVHAAALGCGGQLHITLKFIEFE